MADTSRRSDYTLAAVLALAAFAVSPLGVRLIAGRPDLSFRITVLSLIFAIFLGLFALAVLAQRRLRRALLYLLAAVFPVVLLAGLEVVAVAVHLADVVAPLEDTTLLANKRPWPKHLLSESSYYRTPQGFVLYRPWQGDGVTFNALGLRTAMPTPKAPGEWRIAVTGGSLVWGWHVSDADTLPAQLQQVLRRDGHSNVTVYNFGIGGATLKQELALLEHFRAAYQIDQVLFYTGANDVFLNYLDANNKNFARWIDTLQTFELVKLFGRLQATWSMPSAEQLRRLDDEVLPAALKASMLRPAVVAATAYCGSAGLRCDFVLQPMMFDRKSHTGPEATMADILAHVYPRLDRLKTAMYADAVAAGPAGHIFDLSHMYDGTMQPFFLDFVHENEVGLRLAAEQVAPIVTARLP